MLSPILAFTTDEAWEFIPGNAPDSSVHQAEWAPATFERSQDEAETWTRLFALRERLLPELEKARQGKIIGKALEARLTIHQADGFEANGALKDSLRELLNVSQIDFAPGDSLATVSRAEGEKCERCWHYEPEVGTLAGHPTICARCLPAVSA